VSGRIRGDACWVGRLFPGGAGTGRRIDDACSVVPCEATSAAMEKTHKNPTVIKRIS
jgi:hypothetical protein